MSSNQAVWINKTPSSTSYCRPIKFIFAKENSNIVKNTYNEIINNLECSVIKLNNIVAEVHYEMHCTMIDEAVTNVLSQTNSTSRCFICNAKPTEMNDINISKSPNIDIYKFGLSTLHCWIRCFECLLNIHRKK